MVSIIFHFRKMVLQTVRTDTMAEFSFSVFGNIGFNLSPISFVIPYLFAIRTYGNDPSQSLKSLFITCYGIAHQSNDDNGYHKTYSQVNYEGGDELPVSIGFCLFYYKKPIELGNITNICKNELVPVFITVKSIF